MKKLLFLAMALLTIGFFSCKKDKSIANDAAAISPKAVLTGSYITEIKTAPLVWQVDYFTFNKDEMTSQFEGYNFVFNDPIVIVTTKTTTYYGKWSLTSPKQLILDFQAPPPVNGDGDFGIMAPYRFILSAMNEEWSIREMSLNSIVLEINTETYSKELKFRIKN